MCGMPAMAWPIAMPMIPNPSPQPPLSATINAAIADAISKPMVRHWHSPMYKRQVLCRTGTPASLSDDCPQGGLSQNVACHQMVPQMDVTGADKANIAAGWQAPAGLETGHQAGPGCH